MHGPNEPLPVRRLSIPLQFLRLFGDPLVAILLAASVISGALGQVADAVIIATMVLVGVLINFWQTFESQRAVDRLRTSVAPTATVRRDGSWQEVLVRELVPGDAVRLSAGDLVPADARLVSARDLSVQQSMLTGESLPVEKGATADPAAAATGPDAPHLVFLGTSVISGLGIAIIERTGPRTLFGDIAARLGTRAPESEFERGLRRFSALIMRTTIALVLFIVLVGLALQRDALETLLFAVALGVGLTPEFLPMIAAATLSRGAIRMAREQVVVKHLRAIQDFGSIDVLCSDKTGTLTSGAMRVAASVSASGEASPRALTFARINSQFETGIRSPLDVAILAEGAPEPDAYDKIDELPFDFERRRLSIIVVPRAGARAGATDAGRHLLIAKGAPEGIVERCVAQESAGGAVPLNDAARQRCRDVYTAMSADGLRVLAVAFRWMEPKRAYAREDETDLVLAGFLAFADPVLPEAADVIARLEGDGVAIKILTGDNELVAQHVCRQVGLEAGTVVTGDEVERLDDAALGHLSETAAVFARVSPAQKNRIIIALKRRGHVVGFLGDGVNDAPSLRTADVGVSVKTAADVAREAADIILGQPGLGVLHRGIVEGRRASGNMMKCLLMETSSNFGNMFSMAVASSFLPFLPMLPTQILLNNFLYDVAQIAIPTDNVEPAYLQQPQRWDIGLIRNFMLVIGPISSLFDFLTFYVLLRYFKASEPLFHTGWFVESLATQTLVLFVIRTMGNPLVDRPSRTLTLSTLGVTLVGFLLPATPLGRLLGFVLPPASYLAFVVVATVAYLAAVEAGKRLLRRRMRVGQ